MARCRCNLPASALSNAIGALADGGRTCFGEFATFSVVQQSVSSLVLRHRLLGAGLLHLAQACPQDKTAVFLACTPSAYT